MNQKSTLFGLEDLLLVAVAVVSMGIVGWTVSGGGESVPTVSADAIVATAGDRPTFELPPISSYDCEPTRLARTDNQTRRLAAAPDACRPKI